MSEFILTKSKLKFMKGVSPFVAMVLVIAFGFAAMGIVLTVVNPLLDRAKDSGIINEGTQNIQLLDAAVKAVGSEAQGSKRTVHIKITDGILRSDSVRKWLYYDYTPKTKDYVLNGFAGDVKIESKPIFLEYFNKYSDGNNASDAWTSVNGTWNVSSGRLQGTGGIDYHNVGNQSNFDLAATVVLATSPDGEVYAVPGDPTNLILYIPFDVNTTSTTAYDYSAYKNNGTLLNATAATCSASPHACPSWVNGIYGNATQFDGKGDYINVSTLGSLNINGAVTVVAWVNPSQLSTSYIIGKGPGTSVQSYTMSLGSNGKISFTTNTSTGLTSTGTLTTNAWYHVVGVYNATYLTLYINGALDSSQAWTSIATNTQNVTIGATSSGTSNFNGTIDEVMVFNRALRPDEVAFLYESSSKKISAAGEIPSIGNFTNVSIVLAAPGSSYFTNIKLKSGPALIRMVLPYKIVDLENTTRFGPGDHNIVIKNDGLNTTSNRPLIGINE